MVSEKCHCFSSKIVAHRNIDNAWIALGGSVTIAIGKLDSSSNRNIFEFYIYLLLANGGPPGVIYELIVATAYYSVIAASIAEVSLSDGSNHI